MVSSRLKYPPENSSALTVSGGGFAEFDAMFARLRHRWVKVEFLQEYDETGSEAFEAFLDGDHDSAVARLTGDVKAQDVYRHARENNVEMVRIRVYRTPLTDYLARFEYWAYVADQDMGETIYVVDRATVSELITEAEVSDFLIFDDWATVALLYDEESGKLDEARLASDSGSVQAYIQLVSSLLEASEPLSGSRFETLALGAP